MKKPTVTDIRRMMRELSYDPRKPGPIQAILDVGNQEYYIRRSAEMLTEVVKANKDSQIRNIENSITLLSVALWNLKNENMD